MTESTEQDALLPPLSVGPGQIQFVDACHPPLIAGEFRVGMRQTIKESAESAVPWNSDPYLSDFRFRVEAPRFVLKGADIHCTYPPANAIGRYDNALPHVVLNRRTLPWERALDGSTPELGKPYPPWMALLLLMEDELAVCDAQGNPTGERREVRSLPVLPPPEGGDSLLFPAGKGVGVPDLGQGQEAWKLEAPRWATASCLAIDLPAGLFRAVAPRIDELLYLAHVRQVDTGNKEVLGINDRGWFSVVVGNRVPRSKTAYRVLLVSLEGWKAWLGADANWRPPSGCSLVRLAVLGSWGFVCAGSNDFKAYMNGLNQDRNAGGNRTGATDAWLGLPFDAYDDQRANAFDPQALVNGAYARGYTALEHLMRQGEKTVSWLRGPLVPLNYTKPVQIRELVRCADELLRYDPDWGLFDASFAAAWQMGRLLALQNQGFALALDRVRRQLRRRAEASMRRREAERLQQKIGVDPRAAIEDGVLAFLASGAGRSAVTGAASDGPRDSPGAGGADQAGGDSLEKAAADASGASDEAVDRDLAQVTGWLGRLVLLYGVPFQYLVPQEEMLPAQSIRFFFLDPIWVQCLVQGACSVGRTGYVDGIVDQAMNRTLVPSGPAEGADPSRSEAAAAGVRGRLRQEREGCAPPAGDTTLSWPLTGFLLRSPLVAGWRGLEVLAFREVRDDERDRWEKDGALDADARERLEKDGVVPLAPLRIEQLGDDILIAIFNGVVAQAVVRQPQEGLHFGVERDLSGGGWRKHLHDPDTGASLQDCEIQGVVRAAPESGPSGVVDVVGLAERMQTKLKECDHPADYFGSAAFALQMIESPLEVIFRAQYPEGS